MSASSRIHKKYVTDFGYIHKYGNKQSLGHLWSLQTRFKQSDVVINIRHECVLWCLAWIHIEAMQLLSSANSNHWNIFIRESDFQQSPEATENVFVTDDAPQHIVL